MVSEDSSRETEVVFGDDTSSIYFASLETKQDTVWAVKGTSFPTDCYLKVQVEGRYFRQFYVEKEQLLFRSYRGTRHYSLDGKSGTLYARCYE